MTVREVALGRDIRSPRLMFAPAGALSIHGVRRLLGIVTLVALDLAAVIVALYAQSAAAGPYAPVLWPGLSFTGLIAFCACIVTCLALGSLYGRLYRRHQARRLLTAWVAAFGVSCVLLLLLDHDALGARLVAVWMLALVLSFIARWAFDGVLIRRYGDVDYPRALLVGTRNECIAALGTLSCAPPWQRVAVVGLVATDGPAAAASTAPDGPRVVASPETLAPALHRHGASEVILANPHSLNGGLRLVMDACREQRVALKVVLGDLQLDGHSVSYVPGLDCPFFVVLPRRGGRRSYVLKRIVDLSAASLLLIVLSPLLLLIAALIKLTSRGPVLFVSERIGVDQRPFRFYKFRSMVVDAEAAQEDLEASNECDGVIFKMRADPRVTKVGRVLRRLSLDELPQLLNVLKGDMSIVGPRPLPLRDCNQMDEWHRRRHVVKPGITGLWQVSGRSELGFDQMIDLDVRYIETWTLWMDFAILGRTAAAVISSRGAY